MSSRALLGRCAAAAWVALSVPACGGNQPAGDISDPSDAGEASVPPGKITLFSGKGCIGDFGLAGSNVYFTTPTSVMSVPKTGGTPTTIAPTQGQAVALSLSGDHAYWMDRDDVTGGSALLSAPIGGGTVTTLSSAVVSMTASTAGFFYVDNSGVTAVPVNETSGTILQPGKFSAITADGRFVYVIAYGTNAPETLSRMPAWGGQSQTLTAVDSVAMDFVTDGSYVYWTEGSTSDIVRVPVAGGTPSTVVPGGNHCPTSLTVDGTSVYWVDNCGIGAVSVVMKMPARGGTPVTFATSTYTGGGHIAVDATSLYWWTGDCNGNQEIVKTTPK